MGFILPGKKVAGPVGNRVDSALSLGAPGYEVVGNLEEEPGCFSGLCMSMPGSKKECFMPHDLSLRVQLPKDN